MSAEPKPTIDEEKQSTVVSKDDVQKTIDFFTSMNSKGDQRSMNKLASRLRKEQPALLAFAAGLQEGNDEDIGEASVFYSTLIWAIFDGQHGKKLPHLTLQNLEDARDILIEENKQIEGFNELPLHEQIGDGLKSRQSHICEKLVELMEEDLREEAISKDCANIIYQPTQAVVEAFDAALEGRRPGEFWGPIVRDKPKIGRNEPCPCGSGKKYKKCCAR